MVKKTSNIGNEIIEQIYKKYNYPAKEKLFKLVQKDYPEISRDEINNFSLDSNKESFKEVRTTQKTKLGHITALEPNEIWQIDLFDISKYRKKNKNYDFLFCAVDVFTRRLFVCPIKDKTAADCLSALKIIIKNNKMRKPTILISDNESAFKSELFCDYLEQEDIILDMNIKHDHYALGIVDNMAKRLKKLIGIYIYENDNPRWLDFYEEIVDNYNNNEQHPALGYLVPNDADDSQSNINLVRNINLFKNKDNKRISNFKEGDRVKILLSIKYDPFKKSDTPQYSEHIYIVEKVRRSTVELSNGIIYRDRHLLKVGRNAVERQTPNIRAALKDNKIDRHVRAEGIDRNDDQTMRQPSTRIKKTPAYVKTR